MKGIVYLMCDPLTNTFKIGVTKRDVNKRLKEIQTGNPSEVFVVNTFESDYPYKLEGLLHRHFFSKKMINEWFSLDSHDITLFKPLCEKYENIIKSMEYQVEIL